MYKAGVHLASLFNDKAGKWTRGRKKIFQRLKAEISQPDEIIWMHCASLGEFEQGRPVLEKLKLAYPRYKILLTFFSPSGYEIRKNYEQVDWVFYLPMDGGANARRFVELVNPRLAIFVKYELWHYYLAELNARNIPVLLISALFRKDKPFFKWYGNLHRNMLQSMQHIFVQNEDSKQLLGKIGLDQRTSVAGDTRFDRVVEIAGKEKILPIVEKFANSKTLVAGSTWKEDEILLQETFQQLNGLGLKLIIAPHEIAEKRMRLLTKLFTGAVLFSDLEQGRQADSSSILLVDNIGMLAYLYKYGFAAYVGGGFRTGLHNVLEAAVHDKVVFYGPLYKQHAEAVGLAKTGGGIVVNDATELATQLKKLLLNEGEHQTKNRKAGHFVRANTGATQKIMDYIQENRLLTR